MSATVINATIASVVPIIASARAVDSITFGRLR